MFKKMSALLLSISLISAQFVAVSANQDENTSSTNDYSTDRFIIETNSDTKGAMFSAKKNDISEEDIELAVNDILTDLTPDSSVDDACVSAIEDNSSVVTLPDEVNADEFVQAVEDTLGDNVTIQPDYPIYMNTTQTASTEPTPTSDSSDLPTWEENLAQAQELSTGDGARIAVLGAYFGSMDYMNGAIVDSYDIVRNYSQNSYPGNDANKCELIHKIAPDAKIIPITVFKDDDSNYSYPQYCIAYTSDIVKAIRYAQEKGAQVLVCDWYTHDYNAYLKERMDNANMLFVVSAENRNYNIDPDLKDSYRDTDKYPIYPACFDIDNIIAVSAIRDDYNLHYNACYGKSVDMYAWGNNIKISESTIPGSTNYVDGASAASALVAGAAALVFDKNNSSQNLKDILTQATTTVLYMPGTKDFTSYKVLDFYNSVQSVVSDKKIEINTPRENDTSFSYGDGQYNPISIYYSDIKQMVAAQDSQSKEVAAILLGDGTVKMCVYNNSPSTTHPFDAINSNGQFVDVPQLSNIVQIAISPDGNGFVAVNENGDLYEWGNKSSLGIDSTGDIALPTKDNNISGVESVYLVNGTMWVQLKADENGNKKVHSIGENICRSGAKYEFKEVTEAENATHIYLDSSDAMIIKDNSAYTKRTDNQNDSYFIPSIDAIPTGTIVDGFMNNGQYYAIDNGNVVWTWGKNVGATNIAYYNVSQITGNSSFILLKKSDESGVYSINSTYATNDTISLDTDAKIKSNICFGKNSSSNYGILRGYYVLTEDGNLYRSAIYNSGNSFLAPNYYKIAQKNFDEHTIHSIVPIAFELDYGYEFTDKDLYYLKSVLHYDRVTVTLNDGTDISLPVKWNSNEYEKDKLGEQVITGDFTLPENISNPKTLTAEMRITTKVPITEVETFDPISVEFGTPLSEIESQLAKQAKIWTAKPYADDEEPMKLDVEWDTSKYDPTKPDDYDIYGTLKINNETVSNIYDIRAIIKVTVGVAPDNEIDGILPVENIAVPYNTDLSTLLDSYLPKAADVLLKGGEKRTLDVTNWHPNTTYNPTLSGVQQEFIGDFIIEDNNEISNPDEVHAQVNVIVAPEITGNITESAMKGIDAEQSVPFEQITNVPEFVEVKVGESGTTLLPVEWHPEGIEGLSEPYNPERVSDQPQYVYGTIITNDKITNESEHKAILSVLVKPTSYEVESILPVEADIEVEYGTTLAEVEEQFKAMQDTVTISAKNTATEKVLSLEKELLFAEEDNSTFNPEDTANTQDLIGRVVLPDNMSISDEKRFTLHVKVHEKRNIESMQFITLQAHLYEPVDKLNIPDSLTLALENGKTVSLEVDWKTDGVELNESGKTYFIKGKYVNIPSNINYTPTYDPVVAVYVQNTSYEITSISKESYKNLKAGLELNELYDSMEPKYVTAVLTAVDDPTFSINKDIKFTINEEKTLGNKRPYKPDVASLYTLFLNLDLPANVSYNKTVSLNIQTRKVSIDANIDRTIEAKTVPSNTTFEGLNLPNEITVKLTNNKSIPVNIQWDKTTYTPVQDGKCTVSGTIVNLPKYVNTTDMEFTCEITFTAPEDVLEIESIISTPSAMRVPVGTTISQLNEKIKDETVEVKIKGQEESVNLHFKFTDADNPSYSTEVADTYELKAQLILQDNISNPDNIMLPVSVETYMQIISDVVFVDYEEDIGKTVFVNTAFEDLELPTTVTIITTDGEEISGIPVTWNPDTYDPTLADIQYIEGEVHCPPYLDNPDEVPALCVIYVQEVIDGQVLSLTPVEETSMFSLMSVPIIRRQPQELQDKVKKQRYIVKYQSTDGSIYTKEITLVDIIK